MLWIAVAALLIPALVVYIYMHTGKPRRPGYTGNGDIYNDVDRQREMDGF